MTKSNQNFTLHSPLNDLISKTRDRKKDELFVSNQALYNHHFFSPICCWLSLLINELKKEVQKVFCNIYKKKIQFD